MLITNGSIGDEISNLWEMDPELDPLEACCSLSEIGGLRDRVFWDLTRRRSRQAAFHFSPKRVSLPTFCTTVDLRVLNYALPS
jgi:hypothetical protein